MTPSIKLFPLSVPTSFRRAAARLTLDLLSETDGSVVQFLRELGVTEMNAEQVATDCLPQDSSVDFIAEILRANLENVLRGLPIFPVQGKERLALEECLLWDAESKFDFLKRRLSDEAKVFQDQAGKLRELGCRVQLDGRDAKEVALVVAESKSHRLSENLKARLAVLDQLCSADLGRIPWLLAKDFQDSESFFAPEEVWHSSVRRLVGRVRPVVDGPMNTLRLLGVRTEGDVDDPVLREQLEALQAARDVLAMDCQPIYERLHQAPAGKWIWTEHGFDMPERVSKDPRAHSLQPIMHTLQKDGGKCL